MLSNGCVVASCHHLPHPSIGCPRATGERTGVKNTAQVLVHVIKAVATRKRATRQIALNRATLIATPASACCQDPRSARVGSTLAASLLAAMRPRQAQLALPSRRSGCAARRF